jgi:hypothetical protein
MINVCDFACLVATGLFASKIYLMINYNKNNLLQRFDDLLGEEQKTRYQKIMKERLTIYLEGIILGLILGFIYLKSLKERSTGGACLFTVIVLGTNYLYYMLSKKSDYMIQHLNNEKQRIAWLNIYKEMQYRCKMGFVFGIISFMLYGLFLNL